MSGWVKLHRQLEENIFLMNDDNAYIVFTKLLLFVNSKGQWAGGRDQLSARVHIKSGTLYAVLKRLESQQMVNIKSNRRYSVISICNWRKYQSQPSSKPSNEAAMRQQSDNTLIRIENKNKESGRPKKEAAASQDSPGYREFLQVKSKLKAKI